MKTTFYTKWETDTIEVTANWANAADPIVGSIGGYQVADFRHIGWHALRCALEQAATDDGLDPSDPETEALIEAAMEKADVK